MSIVWDNFKRGGSEKLAMLAMADWCNDQGGSLHPSIQTVAKKINLSESAARRIIHKFIDEGYLTVIGNHNGGDTGQSRRYQLNVKKLLLIDDEPFIDARSPDSKMRSTPSVDDTPCADATPSVGAQVPLAWVHITPSVDDTLTTIYPPIEPPIIVKPNNLPIDLPVTAKKIKQVITKEMCVEVLDYLNEKVGREYKPVRTNLDFIKGRFKEGYSKEEILHVINIKSSHWLTDVAMEKYLRPATLFNATKFSQYVAETEAITAQKIPDWQQKIKAEFI